MGGILAIGVLAFICYIIYRSIDKETKRRLKLLFLSIGALLALLMAYAMIIGISSNL
jgi:hypothetical protein